MTSAKQTSPAAMLAMSKALAKVAKETGDKELAKQAAALACAAKQGKAQLTDGR
jgi:hypothetical protein